MTSNDIGWTPAASVFAPDIVIIMGCRVGRGGWQVPVRFVRR